MLKEVKHLTFPQLLTAHPVEGLLCQLGEKIGGWGVR